MDDAFLNPGELIDGKYEIISMLGRGVMGVVYKARARALNRDVAIKVLTHVDGDTVKRFSAEAQSLARVKHPTVVRVDNFGSSGWGPYLVLSYIPGRDLDAVARLGLSVEDAVSLIIEMCTGVFACHTRSVIHRDLKPSNVLVTDETIWLKRVKILDFGLALPFDSPIIKAHHTRISQIGAVEGVSRYIAPELLRREKPTDRCDQYSIAALLYLLLTSRAPFSDLEGDSLVRAILRGNLLPPRHLCPAIPAALEAVMRRALHPDPLQRFPNVKRLSLAMVPFGPDSLKNKATRYFRDMDGPIDVRLIEPVSACQPNGNPGTAAPSDDVPQAKLPGILISRVVPVEPRAKPRAAEPPPPPPRYHKPARAIPPVGRNTPLKPGSSRGTVWMRSDVVLLVGVGAALGATIATALWVGFFAYYQRHLEPCPPCLSQPAAQLAAPSGNHAAH